MPYGVLIKYGRSGGAESFHTELRDLRANDRCVVRSERGLELGEVLEAPFELPEDFPRDLLPVVLRKATRKDVAGQESREAEERGRLWELFDRKAREQRLRLRLLEVELLFGAEAVIYHFSGRGRPDLRDLVRELTREISCRVELKQVTAKELARQSPAYFARGYAKVHCGKPDCGEGGCGTTDEKPRVQEAEKPRSTLEGDVPPPEV